MTKILNKRRQKSNLHGWNERTTFCGRICSKMTKDEGDKGSESTGIRWVKGMPKCSREKKELVMPLTSTQLYTHDSSYMTVFNHVTCDLLWYDLSRHLLALCQPVALPHLPRWYFIT
jgi:hypothetical protein